jgi:hypothetical protein
MPPLTVKDVKLPLIASVALAPIVNVPAALSSLLVTTYAVPGASINTSSDAPGTLSVLQSPAVLQVPLTGLSQ